MKKLSKSIASPISRLYETYKAAQDGVAAIEFVFVAPIMIAMYFGLAEISLAISTDRKISHSTNVAGDLAAQVAIISAEDMSEIMTATILVMGVPTNKLGKVKLEISSYSKDINNNVVSHGKATLGNIATAFNANDLDPLILNENSGVLVARVTYDYEPLTLKFFTTNYELNETFLLKPRQSENVDLNNGDGITDYTCSLNGRKVTCT